MDWDCMFSFVLPVSFNRSRCTRETSGRFLLLDRLAKKVHVWLWCTFASSGVKKEWSNIAKHGSKWPSKYWISCQYVLVWKHCWYNHSTPAEMSWNSLKFEQIKRKTGRTRPPFDVFTYILQHDVQLSPYLWHPNRANLLKISPGFTTIFWFPSEIATCQRAWWP